jgi:uncharacterized membrane protein YdbT with pleckstrin-like domain
VSEMIIQPTLKFIKTGAVLAVAVVLALEIGYYTSWHGMRGIEALKPLPYAAPVILIWPLVRLLRRHFTKLTIAGDRLRYEAGLAAKTIRNIQLSKIQDVRVQQSLSQRIFGVGDLSIETAGEASRLTIHKVDQPQAIADQIMDAAQRQSPAGGATGVGFAV